MKIGIILAMDKEYAQLHSLLESPREEQIEGTPLAIGHIGDKEVIMQKCGIGKVNAAIGATKMILSHHPHFDADSDLYAKALALDCATPVHGGLMVSGDWFVDSREKMRDILALFPDAKAVDMESCAIAQVC